MSLGLQETCCEDLRLLRYHLLTVFYWSSARFYKQLSNVTEEECNSGGDGTEAMPTAPVHASRVLDYGHGSAHSKCISENVLGCWWEVEGTRLLSGV